MSEQKLNKINSEKKPLVQSVERALDILNLLAERRDALRSVDISEAVGLQATTGHNLVRTLYRRGYLYQDEHGRYGLGPGAARLGEAADRWADLRQAALPLMASLNQETGDGVFLGVMAGEELHCVALLEAAGHIKVAQEQNWLDMLHCTAAGKILLAQFSAARLEAWLARTRLEQHGPRSIVEPVRLREELELTRKRGWAECRDEAGNDVSVLGVPLHDAGGRVIAALSQSFPTFYLDSGRIEAPARIERLKLCAEGIGAQLAKK